MLKYFVGLMRKFFDVDGIITICVNCYLTDGLTLSMIEDYWLDILDLPRDSLRKSTVNNLPSSSKGFKKNKLKYGICHITVNRTEIVQHIFGAIQEYGNFTNDKWLD